MTESCEQQIPMVENRLRELELLIDSVEDYAIVLIDPQGKITSCNPAAQRMSGYAAEEVLRRHVSIFYSPEDVARGKPDEELSTAAAKGRFEDEGWRIRKDGSLFWANVTVTALRDAAGKITGFGKVTRDLTHRKWGEEEKFGKIFHFNPTALCISTLDEGRFVEVNEAFCRFTGYTREELIGHTSVELGLWPHPEERDRLIEELRAHHSLREVERTARHKDGEEYVGLVSCEFIDLGGEACLLAAIRDITERRRMEEQLRHANEKLASWVGTLERRTKQITLLGKLADMLQSCLTAEEAYQVVANSASELFPSESGALYVKETPTDTMEAVAVWGDSMAGERLLEPDQCWALRRGRAHWVEDSASGITCRHLSVRVPASWLCVPITANGETLGMFHLQSGVANFGAKDKNEVTITRAKRGLALSAAEHIAMTLANLKLRDKLQAQSTRDALTGLFNRRYMEESAQRELRRAARKQRELSVIMIDVDHFKELNDTFGHDAGDAMLCEIARMLQTHSRKDDIACRYGGEEFVVILPEASLEASRQRAEQLRQKIKNLNVHHRGVPLTPVTLSFGIAGYPAHGASLGAILRAADVALYRAKREGRDRVIVSDIATAV